MNNESEYLFQLAYDKELNDLKKLSTRNEKLIDIKGIDTMKTINTMFILYYKKRWDP